MNSARWALLAVACLALAVAPVWAAVFTWTDASADWNTGANWFGGTQLSLPPLHVFFRHCCAHET
jgi:hypothetical protein